MHRNILISWPPHISGISGSDRARAAFARLIRLVGVSALWAATLTSAADEAALQGLEFEEDSGSGQIPRVGARPPEVSADGIDVIVVTGRKSPSLTADTADDARTRLLGLAASASVVDVATLQTQRTQTLADALRLAPGVFAAPRFGDEDLRLSIRGSGVVRTGHGKGMLLIRDGVPVNQADGNFDPPVFDFASTSHISILRGTAAMGTGASTLGGALVVNSRTGLTSPGASMGVVGGSFGQRRVNAEAGISGEKLDGYAAITASDLDGYRRQSQTDTVRISANAGYRHSPDLETRLFAAYVRFNSEWPGALTAAQFDDDPKQANPVAVARDLGNDIRQLFLSSRTVWVLGDQTWTFGAGWNDRSNDHATPGGILEEDSKTISALLDWAYEPAAGRLTLAAGLRGVATDQDALVFGYAGGINSPQASDKGALNTNRDRRAVTAEAYVRAGYALTDALSVSASLAGIDTTRRANPVPRESGTRYDESYDHVMPGLGLLWRSSPNWSAFASIARTVEAPSFFDMDGNAPLHPDGLPRLRLQRADTVEAGARGEIGRYRFDATLYHAWLDGELLRIDAAGQLNPPIVNADDTTRSGFEGAIEASISDALWAAGPALTVAAKYDWNRMRFDDDPVYGSNVVAGIPEHSGYGELRFEFPFGLTVTPNLLWRGSTYTDLANTDKASSEFLLGAMAVFERGGWRLWVEGRNLTDQRWVSAVNVVNQANPNAALYFPGDGRAVFAGLAVNVGR